MVNDDIILISKEKFDDVFDIAKKNSDPDTRENLDKMIENIVLIERSNFETLFTNPKGFILSIMNEGLLKILFSSSEPNFIETLQNGVEQFKNLFSKEEKED